MCSGRELLILNNGSAAIVRLRAVDVNPFAELESLSELLLVVIVF